MDFVCASRRLPCLLQSPSSFRNCKSRTQLFTYQSTSFWPKNGELSRNSKRIKTCKWRVRSITLSDFFQFSIFHERLRRMTKSPFQKKLFSAKWLGFPVKLTRLWGQESREKEKRTGEFYKCWSDVGTLSTANISLMRCECIPVSFAINILNNGDERRWWPNFCGKKRPDVWCCP